MISYIQDKQYAGWTDFFEFFYTQHQLEGRFDAGFYPDFKLEDEAKEEDKKKEEKNAARKYKFGFRLDTLDI